MAESSYEGRSKNFAIEMLRSALHIHGIKEIWVSHSLRTFDDDNPDHARHFLVKVNLEHYRSIEAECWVFPTALVWSNGAVRFYSILDGKPFDHRPKMHFRYHAEKGMELTARHTIVVQKTGSGYKAVLADETEGLAFGGKTDYEAVGRLVANFCKRLGIAFEVLDS